MISAKQCRMYAAECKMRASSSDVSTQRSVEHRIMALNWLALADEIDRERLSSHICGIFIVGRRSDSQFPEAFLSLR
jgi:hypothetical protein